MDEATLHELLSGRSRGVSASVLRGLLKLAAMGYSAAMLLRNAAYQCNWLKIHRASVPVISLGNLTTGGTGKTPLAAWLANRLLDDHRRPGLLSRGYRALAAAAHGPNDDQNIVVPGNDEKLVLDRLCPGIPHIQQKDRVSAAQQAVQELGCDVLLLDDGFQHRRLSRDLDLVLIDALQPWGYGQVLPRGLLREPLYGLSRADLVLITRADQCSDKQRGEIRAILERYCPGVECLDVAFKPVRLVDLEWQPHPLKTVSGKTGLGFCGIGNPAGFRETIASLGVTCGTFCRFDDHHHYSHSDLKNLAEQARLTGVEVVLTTQKDLVKIRSSEWHGPPLFAVEIGVEFLRGGEVLEEMLRQLPRRPKT